MFVNLRVVDGVALRKESVDRNHIRNTTAALPSIVALRKESVDRNRRCIMMILKRPTSLSARRAWIEITSIAGRITSNGSRSPQGERG